MKNNLEANEESTVMSRNDDDAKIIQELIEQYEMKCYNIRSRISSIMSSSIIFGYLWIVHPMTTLHRFKIINKENWFYPYMFGEFLSLLYYWSSLYCFLKVKYVCKTMYLSLSPSRDAWMYSNLTGSTPK